ncbi:MAG: hypothetical protein HRU09_15655 [Oligoflexales bacterium]|nr:hypothetical protein [Oligoflexales bacterium]
MEKHRKLVLGVPMFERSSYCFKLYSLISLVMLTFVSVGVAAPKSKNLPISNGDRYINQEKGFSIIPPVGWEVHTDYPNLSLLMQVPFSKGLAYQRTIQIMAFKGPKYIDDITRRDFEKIIVQRYSKVSQSIKNFRVRNHMITKMEDEREGVLYYTEFDLEHKRMMQAHILVSSSSRSYLLTYTDVIEHFEGDKASQYLTKAWESMTSIKLGSDAPVRFQKTFLLGLIAICILILLILFYLIRHAKAGKSYTDHTQSEHLTEDDLKDVSEHDEKETSIYATEEPKLTENLDDGDDDPLKTSTDLDSDDEWNFAETPKPPAPPSSDVEAGQKKQSEYNDAEDDDVWK